MKFAADKNSPIYVAFANYGAEVQNLHDNIITAIMVNSDFKGKGEDLDAIVASYIKSPAYVSEWPAIRGNAVAGLIAKNYGDESARTTAYAVLKALGFKAPGKNGKRGKKAVEPLVVTLESWIACFKSSDWDLALKMAAQQKKAKA
jgi:hypothetical protein